MTVFSLVALFSPLGLIVAAAAGTVGGSAMAAGGAAGIILAIPPFAVLLGSDPVSGIFVLLTGLFSVL